jgi:dTDP-4-amino-4,6-dideoxygalactose transaminase
LRIPLVDLRWQLDEVRDEIEAGWTQVLETSSFILGNAVDDFERSFARYCGVDFCVGVGNGTDAIEIGLRSLDIGPGDKVIVPANTFIATALAVLRAGADVQLVDCVPRTYLIDVEAAHAVRTVETRGVIPVHLFGQVAPIETLQAAFSDVPIIEDAAQAQGAERHGSRAGSLAVLAATSFYPGKNIGAFGDAGAVMTSDPRLAARVRALRNWGSDEKYHHPVVGFNSRLDTLQSVVLSAKLGRLDKWNELRREAAAYYDQLIGDSDQVQKPETLAGNHHVFHLYVIEVDNRDAVLSRLHAAGVGAGVHYPIPIHLQGALSHLGHKVGDFPVAEAAAARSISLPMYPGIARSDQELVVEVLLRALR